MQVVYLQSVSIKVHTICNRTLSVDTSTISYYEGQEKKEGLKLNGTHQLLSYADDVNLLPNKSYYKEKDTGTFIGASKEVGIGVTAERTKCTLLSRHQDALQNLNEI
jgi:hypothetical protein